MKDIKLTVAAFITIMLILPAISLKSNVKVQHKVEKYSYSPVLEVDTAQAGASGPVFKILRTSTGKVEEVPYVDYICGVVAAEVPASYQPEALKAQAVAAFTYACYYREHNMINPGASAGISGADLSDDYRHYDAYISKQEAQTKWGSSFDGDWSKIVSAVDAVKNKVITYNGKPIEAAFFGVSTGKTESSANVWGNALPYLVPVNSEWDESSSDYKSSVKVKQDDFKAKVLAKYKDAKFDKNPSSWITVKKSSASGIVLTVELCGKSLSGDDIKSLFALNAADFAVSLKNDMFVFDVRGDGHDVGMSQNGAEYLAEHGKKWDEIVKYYYTGVSISDYNWQ
jgi:stage II sporulation protein D